MQVLLGTPNNIYTAVLSVSGLTLTISNVTGFDLTDSSLSYIYDVTASKQIPSLRVTCALTRVAGKPVWVFTFETLPTGVADGDTLVIYLNVPDAYYLLPQTQYNGSVAP